MGLVSRMSSRSWPRRLGATGFAAFCTVAVTMAAGASPAAATTKLFEFTGAEQSFLVPAGVHKLHVELVGGTGGEGGAIGGAAAAVSGDLEVTPGQTIYVEVGGNGKKGSEGSAGGFNGGGAGSGGGGGGGASDLRLEPSSAGLSSLTSRVAIAAGGGGGGGDGGEAGGNGGAAGNAGETSSGGNGGGGAGTASSGGGGGFGCGGSGSEGSLGEGGGGGSGEGGANGGGGGGGGLYGGGGGAGGCSLGGGGGGGGASLVPAGGEVEIALDTVPKIEISYTPPPAISIVSPGAGGSYTLGQTVTASYSCSPQEGSTLEECAGPVANGAPIDTATLGQHTFTVSAEDSEGGTSSKTVKYTVLEAAPPAPTPSPSPPGPSPPAPSPPNTVLGSHPPKKIKTTGKKVKVKFTFSSPTAGATFKCKLDKGAFAACASPKAYRVKPGKHKFSVAAVSGGLVDPTPATFGFKVVKTA